MSDTPNERAEAERVLVIEHDIEIDRIKALSTPQAEIMRLCAARAGRLLAQDILAQAAIFSEVKTDTKTIYRFRVAVITPDDRGVSFSNQIDAARRKGVLLAAAALEARAVIVALADGQYGGPQALALRSAATELREQADVIGKD